MARLAGLLALTAALVAGATPAVCLAGKAPPKPPVDAAPPSAAQIDQAVKDLAEYQLGKPASPLDTITSAVRAAGTDAAARKGLALKLVTILDGAATADAKRFVCRTLRQIGGAESVGALAKLLADEQLSHMARYALEPMEDPSAGAALRDALGKVKGKTLVGVVNSLGARRDSAAVAQIAALIGDADADVAEAALAALGRIGSAGAVDAIGKAQGLSATRAAVAVDALLACAERLAADGSKDAAVGIYRSLLDRPGSIKLTRLAALRGLSAVAADQAVPALLGALSSDDPTTSAAAMQMARELPGEAATKALIELAAKSAPARQAAVIEALGLRGDVAAYATVKAAATSADASVRAAGLRALGGVGSAADVTLLAEAAAQSTGPVREAARSALERLRGETVDAAIIALAQNSRPAIQAQAVQAISARNLKTAAPVLAQLAESPDAALRIEAIKALGMIGDDKSLPAVLKVVAGAKEDSDRDAAAAAAIAIYRRCADKQAASGAIVAALSANDPAARRALLRLCGQIGGAKPLAALRAGIKDTDASVRDAATRALADFPEAEAMPDLLAAAKGATEAAHQTLALRGYVRLAGLMKTRQPDERVAAYEQAMGLAKRNEEKWLVLSGLSACPTAKAIKLVASCIGQAGLTEEASVAAVKIGRALGAKGGNDVREAMEAVVQSSKNQQTVGEAKDIIKGLGSTAPKI
jgi:HEAT repeat protein